MSAIPNRLRQLVIQRADNRCEYCGVFQIGQVATFQIDHIVPVIAGGQAISENLALACVSCSLRKEPLDTGIGLSHDNGINVAENFVEFANGCQFLALAFGIRCRHLMNQAQVLRLHSLKTNIL